MANNGLADIRKAAAGSARSMREFQRAVKAIRARAIRAVQVEGKAAFRRMAQRYESVQLYADAQGRLVEVEPYGEKWRKRKKRLKLDMRRGIARKGVLKTIKSPLAFVQQPNGFDIDYSRPNLTITGRATVGRSERMLAGIRFFNFSGGKKTVAGIGIRKRVTSSRSFLVNAYLGHFAKKKAPGLGSLATFDRDRIQQAVHKAVDELIGQVKGAARKALTRRQAHTIVLRLDRAVGA